MVTVRGANFVEGSTTVEVGGQTVAADVGAGRSIADVLSFIVPVGAGAGQGALIVATPYGASAPQEFTVLRGGVTASTPTTAGSGSAPNADGPISPSPAPSGAGLARTGTDLRPLLVVGLLLVAAGALATYARRRLTT